jgi:hypothetical protein
MHFLERQRQAAAKTGAWACRSSTTRPEPIMKLDDGAERHGLIG